MELVDAFRPPEGRDKIQSKKCRAFNQIGDNELNYRYLLSHFYLPYTRQFSCFIRDIAFSNLCRKTRFRVAISRGISEILLESIGPSLE
jgi:hypothetical protein